jgi:hypothetical protein
MQAQPCEHVSLHFQEQHVIIDTEDSDLFRGFIELFQIVFVQALIILEEVVVYLVVARLPHEGDGVRQVHVAGRAYLVETVHVPKAAIINGIKLSVPHHGLVMARLGAL